MAFCSTNGIILHYTRTGGNKPSLVMLHGLTASGNCWSESAHFLDKDYDIIMPDARGHGESASPDSGFSYEDHAEDVTGLIKSLGLKRPVLLGHSMVGTIKGPSLLIFVDKGVMSYSTACEIQNVNPLFRIVQIPGAGHGLHYDRPKAFANAVCSFISSLESKNYTSNFRDNPAI